MFFANSTKLFVNIFTSGLCSITSSTRNRAIAIFPTIPFTIHYKCNWLIYKGVEQLQMHIIWLIAKFRHILNTRTMLSITLLFYIMLSLTCPSEHFFHNFSSPIYLGASSTWLGAISNIPFTPYTINLKLKFDKVGNRLYFIRSGLNAYQQDIHPLNYAFIPGHSWMLQLSVMFDDPAHVSCKS